MGSPSPQHNRSHKSAVRRAALDRRCRFEQFETRTLLAANVVFGDPLTPDTEVQSAQHAALAPAAAELTGRVVVAEACDAAAHASATGVAEVRILLLGSEGELVAERLTGPDGRYLFADLEPGVYAVQQVQPRDLFDGKTHIGSGGGQVLTRNLVGEITIGAGQVLTGYDFCEFADPEASGFWFSEGPLLENFATPGGLSPLAPPAKLAPQAPFWIAAPNSLAILPASGSDTAPSARAFFEADVQATLVNWVPVSFQLDTTSYGGSSQDLRRAPEPADDIEPAILQRAFEAAEVAEARDAVVRTSAQDTTAASRRDRSAPSERPQAVPSPPGGEPSSEDTSAERSAGAKAEPSEVSQRGRRDGVPLGRSETDELAGVAAL